MLVREVMTANPVTVRPEAPLKQALTLLATHRITSLPVVDEHGKLAGVVSEADLIRDLVREDPRSHEIPLDDEPLDRPVRVEDVMTPHAVAVPPDTELKKAVDLITSTTVKSVPVVDDHHRVIGMLSRGDVVRMLARADETLAADVDALLSSTGLTDWTAEVTDGTVTLTGPSGSPDRRIAHLLAGTVPGVVEVVAE